LRAAGQVFSPARGFWVLIPPEFRSWRAVPASRFADVMMRALDRTYYVALLSAAAADLVIERLGACLAKAPDANEIVNARGAHSVCL
jgi:hypothetical protein